MKEYKNLNDLHDLEMHERMFIRRGFYVTRVPGGWLYETSSTKNVSTFKKESNPHISTVFVPYIDNRVFPADEHDF